MNARIPIGTSGWHYPHWRGEFYPARLPARAWLGYFAERLSCGEINNSFYDEADYAVNNALTLRRLVDREQGS
jgi:uncharacterized protein YecE (DUF72 family)